MQRALHEYSVHPIKTTIPLFLEIMADEDFRRGDFNTGFIDKFIPDEDDDDDEDD
jgi:biotin carboxylase